MTEPEPFKGIPSAKDFIPYSKYYYKVVEKVTVSRFGENATIYDAIKGMALCGNVQFFNWFPDLFETDPKKLKNFYNPRLGLAGNSHFVDYLHGLTHIRSLSEHTNLGEALVVPDNLWNNGIRYQGYLPLNTDKALDDCTSSPYDEFQIESSPIPYKKLYKMNVRVGVMQFHTPKMRFYEAIYREGQFKVDFAKESPSEYFLNQPQNEMEERMATNVVRTIYLDQKYKAGSKGRKSFIRTPVNESAKDHYSLLFTNDKEDQEINEIVRLVQTFDLKTLHLSREYRNMSSFFENTIEVIKRL